MAIIYRCDRCKQDVPSDEIHKIQIPRGYDESNYPWDLCKSCLNQVIKFVRNEK